MKILVGGEIAQAGRLVADQAVVFDQQIRAIVPAAEIERFRGEVIHYSGVLLPGFIDIHIHGAGGADTMDGTTEALETIAETIVQSGTTAFLATTMTMEPARIERSLQAIRDFRSQQTRGAQCLGAHLEGPFINPEYKGAQQAQHIQAPNAAWVADYLDVIRMITLAPEMDPDFEFIRQLKDRVVLSMGHSGADYATAVAAVTAGIQHVTHCFNAMRGLHQREPGVVGAALTQDISLDLITDLIHVHPDLFQVLLKLKGRERVIAITDAIRAAFLSDGTYDLGGQKVQVSGAKCTLEDGTIAGSVHRMDKALKNLIKYSEFNLAEVSESLSASPAKLLGIDDKKGHIKPGYDADLVILKDLSVSEVYIRGGKQ